MGRGQSAASYNELFPVSPRTGLYGQAPATPPQPYHPHSGTRMSSIHKKVRRVWDFYPAPLAVRRAVAGVRSAAFGGHKALRMLSVNANGARASETTRGRPRQSRCPLNAKGRFYERV